MRKNKIIAFLMVAAMVWGLLLPPMKAYAATTLSVTCDIGSGPQAVSTNQTVNYTGSSVTLYFTQDLGTVASSVTLWVKAGSGGATALSQTTQSNTATFSASYIMSMPSGGYTFYTVADGVQSDWFTLNLHHDTAADPNASYTYASLSITVKSIDGVDISPLIDIGDVGDTPNQADVDNLLMQYGKADGSWHTFGGWVNVNVFNSSGQCVGTYQCMDGGPHTSPNNYPNTYPCLLNNLYTDINWSGSALSDFATRAKWQATLKASTTQVQAIACYWGINTDGTKVNLASNTTVYSGTITAGNIKSVPVNLSKTFTGYDFKESKLSYTGNGSDYTGTVTGAAGKNRTVTLSEAHPTIYVYFFFDQTPPPGTPTLGIDADKYTVPPGESYTIKDLCKPSQAATKITKWTVREEFQADSGETQTLLPDTVITTASQFFKTYTRTEKGTYTYYVTRAEDDKGNYITGSASVSVAVKDENSGGSTEPPAPSNKPPTAIIRANDTVMAGDDMWLDGSQSFDGDGTIERYEWSLSGVSGSSSRSGYRTSVWFPNEGDYTQQLEVWDDQGASDSTTKAITVLPPIPTVGIAYIGHLKENRKITVTCTGTSPAHYPIDPSKTRWEFTAVSGCNTGDIKYLGGLTGTATKEFIVKKAGKIRITAYMTNTANYTGSAAVELDIRPDLAPVVDFTYPTENIRDQVDAGGHYANIPIYDMSYSPDGDAIGSRKYFFMYDSDNDGDFSDEAIVPLSSANNLEDVIKTYSVGTYRIGIEVQETIPDSDTIKDFLTAEDYKKSSFWK
ncbi:MAG: PKD domain-containing protein [Clostridiales bacterium]|jgi:hypothetical protein|nr:PKD domain-containing protein [Eubacteriales bacterium]MDH7566138.1 PKD domain-containing protein [Clostridiales bacterium]